MTLGVALFVGLLLHMIGDYVTQSTWMANEKVRRDWPAWMHAIVYSVPFYFLLASMVGWVGPIWDGGGILGRSFFGGRATWALTVILYTHFVIDRYRMAKHLVWLKNQVAPKSYRYRWKDKAPHGYAKDVPDWLGFWLMVLADNTVHVTINSAMIAWVYYGGR